MFCIRAGDRKCDAEDRSFSQLALDGDFSVHAFYDVPDDRKSQASATHRARAGFIDPIKSLEDTRQILRRDSYAVISNPDAHRSISGLRDCDLNLARVTIEFHSVGQ